MMRRFNPPPAEPFVAGGSAPAAEWEVRPSGMLVQKRETAAVPAAPTIRVKVKYGEGYHEIYVSADATFGDVKKRVAERIGMHHLDLKVMFKDRERDSAAFIDVAGVKEGSKMLVVEDPTAKAKRILEERRQHKMDKAAKQVSAISVEVDRLIAKVTALEAIVSKGSKVVEKDILQLIELLMAQLIQLDGVVADGDAKVQRGLQVRRVQRYVEVLDAIKIKNEDQTQSNPPQKPQTTHPKPLQKPQKSTHSKPQQHPLPSAAMETTKWETFDALFSPSTSTVTSKAATPVPRFKWELF